MGPGGDSTWFQGLPETCDPELMRIYHQFTEVQTSHSRPIRALSVERPAFRMAMEEGVLFREDPELPGGSRVYVFQGKGLVDFSVAEPMEVEHLRQISGRKDWRAVPIEDVLFHVEIWRRRFPRRTP
jgi:hypothetical protein